MHTSPLAQPGQADAGGMNVYVRQLAAALARSGSRCEVFTRKEHPGQPASVTLEPGFRAHHVEAGPTTRVPKERLPELVETWAAGVAAGLQQLSRAGEGVELLHANYWLSAAAGHSLKHALDLPLVCSFHTLQRVKSEAGDDDPTLAARREVGEQSAIGCSDAILACSATEAEQLGRLYSADPLRIEIVPPGVDHAFFSPGDRRQARRALDLPEDLPVILFVGRIQPLKGLLTAVSALAQLARRPGRAGSAHLVVVGGASGPKGDWELERSKDVVSRYRLGDRAHFVAPQPHERLSTYYRAADVCVVPSRSESFGLVALEAAACGVPVVASAVGGLAELVSHGRTGYLVPPEDVSAFALYLGEVVEDRSLGRLLGSAASQVAMGYTWAGAANKLRALGKSMADRELVSCS